MTILITGAGGMMGSHLAEMLVEQGQSVYATFFEPTIDISRVNPAVNFSVLDVCNRDSVFDFIHSNKPHEIYHLAAQSLPIVSWTDPWTTFRVNTEGTINIFEAIISVRKNDSGYSPMTVIACSSAEYGASLTPDRIPIKEDAPLMPMHPYGVSKVAQDLLGWQYWSNHGLRCIRARIFNCTGPRKRNDVVSDFGRALAQGLFENSPIRHGNLETRRAIIDVRDMVSALVSLARKGKPGEAYNICADSAIKISDLLELYFEIAGYRLPTEPDPRLFRPSDEPIIIGDTNRIRHDTEWSPKIPLEQTLRDVLSFEKELYAEQRIS